MVNEAAESFVRLVTKSRELTRTGEDINDHDLPQSLECVPASFALLRASYKSLLIKGGPGVGKSTLTQFLTLYHASRLVYPALAARLAKRLKLPKYFSSESLDAHCAMRFPLRIELRRFAKWVSDAHRSGQHPHFSAYFAEIMNKESSSSLGMEDIFLLASQNPVLLILDGLDEVPQPSTRDVIFRELRIFLDRCETEGSDINVIVSSRPQGYRGEFDGFEPLEWQVVDLSRTDFDDYSSRWLEERIGGLEERNDALQRVEHGMQSQAVQLMAKTLLQATVMLTIAKRKHAIPHAKHKLYEKFVEVTFEREQNKQPVIRDRSEELKRLHEKVGFELICKMERHNDAQTLEGLEFRSCVERVILDYGSRLTANGASTTEIINEIVTLAQDRLCLLAGKGEQQKDIDFVIQPFREYFAAAYIARHEGADPHRTYKALTARQHIWANVLQFYAAFQNPAQQRNWIAEADGIGRAAGEVESQVEMTRMRRTLVRLIPEFERPRNEYICRAFANLMELSTRWTWRDRRAVAELLNVFAQNEAFGYFRECFRELSVDDVQSLLVEVDLLTKTAGSSDRAWIDSTLAELLKSHDTRWVAFRIAFINKLSIDVSATSLEDLRRCIPLRYEDGRRWGRDFKLENLLGISNGKIVDLVISGTIDASSFGSATDRILDCLFRVLRGPENLFGLSGVGIFLPLYCFERSDAETIKDLLAWCEGLTDCASRSYICAILRAFLEPADITAYNLAENEATELGRLLPITEDYVLEAQLGPSPTGFPSVDEWQSARRSVYKAGTQELADWVANLDGLSWMILFIPESAWTELQPDVSRSKLEDLSGPVLDRLKLMTFGQINKASLVRMSGYEIDLCACFNSLARVAYACGKDSLAHSEIFTIFSFEASKVVPGLSGREILSRAENLSVNEDACAWAVGYALSSGDVEAGRILSFWRASCPNKVIWVMGDESPLIERILALGTDDAIKMAASVRSQGRPNREPRLTVRSSLAAKFCKLLLRQKTFIPADFQILWGLPVQMEEILVWDNDDALRGFERWKWGCESFRDRLIEIVNTCSADAIRLRTVLGKIVDKRRQYTSEIGLGAMDAIQRLDEITSRPLTNADWQSEQPVN